MFVCYILTCKYTHNFLPSKKILRKMLFFSKKYHQLPFLLHKIRFLGVSALRFQTPVVRLPSSPKLTTDYS